MNENDIAAERQKLFGEPWWRSALKPSPVPRSVGTEWDHCEICPFAVGERCNKACADARKELDDKIDVTFPT